MWTVFSTMIINMHQENYSFSSQTPTANQGRLSRLALKMRHKYFLLLGTAQSQVQGLVHAKHTCSATLLHCSSLLEKHTPRIKSVPGSIFIVQQLPIALFKGPPFFLFPAATFDAVSYIPNMYMIKNKRNFKRGGSSCIRLHRQWGFSTPAMRDDKDA